MFVFSKMERVRGTGATEYFRGAPELAVEIVSPSETAEMLQRKIELLLGAGSLAVWAVYLPKQKVQVHLPDGSSFTRGVGDVLTMPELLPGWELPVAQISRSSGQAKAPVPLSYAIPDEVLAVPEATQAGCPHSHSIEG